MEPWTDPDDPQLDEVLRRIFCDDDELNTPHPDRKVVVTVLPDGTRHSVVTREDGSQFTVDVAPKPTVCEWPNCGEEVKIKGLCQLHYQRWRRRRNRALWKNPQVST